MFATPATTARRWIVLTTLLALVVALLPVNPAAAARREPPPLPRGVAELARQLEGATVDDRDPPPSDAEDVVPQDDRDPGRRLEELVAAIRVLHDGADRRTAAGIARAADALVRAADALASGSDDGAPGPLRVTLDHLSDAIDDLETAGRTADRTTAAALAQLRVEAATVGRDAAIGLIVLAIDRRGGDPVGRELEQTWQSGLDKLVAGDAGGAIDDIGDAFTDGSALVEFDVALFEQNLRDAFDGEAVGYTYAIAQTGTIVAEDGVGEARTAPDSPAPQFADKQVQVASVSKTLTAILILRLMDEHDVDPGDLIAPYLPGNWVLGDGMDQITFEQLLTHTSGFKQLANVLPEGTLAHDYDGLQTLVGLDLTDGDGPYGYLYTNLNFSLLRVLAAGLMDIDPVDYPEFEGETLTASAFAIYLDSVYSGIGVPTSCTPTDPQPTLMYQWPLDGVTPGGESSDKVLTCGAFGFFISAHQLAGVLANLRYTENLLSTEQFDLMRDGLLGLQSWSGAHGTYYGHSGQWNPGMQSCVMMFSIAVDVAITVNSIGGDYPKPCTVARQAFDDAWVAV